MIRRDAATSTDHRALQQGVRRRSARRRRACCAKPPALTGQRIAEAVPDAARRCVPLERLLRERPGLDGSGRAARYHHRPLRDLQRRAVRLQGGVRSLHHHSRRRGNRPAQDRSPATCRRWRTTCRIEPRYRNPKLGALGAHPRGERSLRRGRWRARRPHGGLQSAQRRARGAAEGQQARDAEERAGGQVSSDPGAHRRRAC